MLVIYHNRRLPKRVNLVLNITQSKPQSRTIVNFLPSLDSNLGGLVTAVLNIGELMADQGYRVEIWTYDRANLRSDTLSVVQLTRRELLRDGARLFEKHEGECVLHLHTPWCLDSVLLGRIARKHSVPYVVSTHGMLDGWCMQIKPWRKLAFLRLVSGKFLRSAATLHTTANFEQEQVIQRLQVSKSLVAVVPLPLPHDQQASAQAARSKNNNRNSEGVFGSASTFNVLFLGRINPIKNLETVIDAVDRVKKRGLSVKLTLAGPFDPPYRTQLDHHINDLGLTEQVDFTGYIGAKEKVDIIAQTDVAVLVGHHENFGMAIVELMLQGIPAIVSPNVAIWRELRSGNARIASSSDELSEHLLDLANNRSLAERMGERGREFVSDWLSPESLIVKYETLFGITKEIAE